MAKLRKKPKYPLPPRSMCRSWLHYILGIRSPSCEFRLRICGPRNEAERKFLKRIDSYNDKMDRYKIHTRTMTRGEWKEYFRAKRIKKRLKERPKNGRTAL